MDKNTNLHNAKSAKKDEFYTQLVDIEKELIYYKEHFKDKVVFCNCDNPEISNFWKFFEMNFDSFQLKRLVSIHFEISKETYKLEINTDIVDNIKIKSNPIKTTLKGYGDFMSPESISELKTCDIVVTNPPFSLFKEFVKLLDKNNKKFLIIGNPNAITYKEIFKIVKKDKLWLGVTKPVDFESPYPTTNTKVLKLANGNHIEKINAVWFTNLEKNIKIEEIELTKEYNEIDYPKYDNYDAIEVNKLNDIPKDYFKTIAVNVNFLNKYNHEQFEIIKKDNSEITVNNQQIKRSLIKIKNNNENVYITPLQEVQEEDDFNKYPILCNGVIGVPVSFMEKYNSEQFELLDANDYGEKKIAELSARPFLNGKELYRRILIRHKL